MSAVTVLSVVMALFAPPARRPGIASSLKPEEKHAAYEKALSTVGLTLVPARRTLTYNVVRNASPN
jgi:hypothetical protein